MLRLESSRPCSSDVRIVLVASKRWRVLLPGPYPDAVMDNDKTRPVMIRKPADLFVLFVISFLPTAKIIPQKLGGAYCG